MKQYNLERYILIAITTTIVFILFLFFLIIGHFALRKVVVKIANDQQLIIQQQEAQDRKNNPASETQLEEMEKYDKLCFHNDDCRTNSQFIPSCGNIAYNKYAFESNRVLEFYKACPANKIYYFYCKENNCVLGSKIKYPL